MNDSAIAWFFAEKGTGCVESIDPHPREGLNAAMGNRCATWCATGPGSEAYYEQLPGAAVRRVLRGLLRLLSTDQDTTLRSGFGNELPAARALRYAHRVGTRLRVTRSCNLLRSHRNLLHLVYVSRHHVGTRRCRSEHPKRR